MVNKKDEALFHMAVDMMGGGNVSSETHRKLEKLGDTDFSSVVFDTIDLVMGGRL
jgi:hypothetical protein